MEWFAVFGGGGGGVELLATNWARFADMVVVGDDVWSCGLDGGGAVKSAVLMTISRGNLPNSAPVANVM
jgi:hypothetical protein